MNDEHFIGHRHDRSFEELSESISKAALMGDELQIKSLQEEMRLRFGDLF